MTDIGNSHTGFSFDENRGMDLEKDIHDIISKEPYKGEVES